jgi:DNA-binding transcriptional regulator YdaS (Cro superfamily)
MKTKQAVNFVLKQTGLTKYALAWKLGCAPASVDQWTKRTRMSRAYAAKFYNLFKITITDAV